jgi:hypothetical protein
LSTDSKSVCNEAIEQLLLTSNVTAADIWSCTIDWSKACDFLTLRGTKSPLSYYFEQARVAAAFRCTLKQPDIQRQISNTSSDPDSVFGSASSAADPVFGASSDDGNGAPWGTPSERAAFAARVEEAKKASLSSTSRSGGPAPFGPSGDCFYGATLAQVRENPTQFAPLWTNTNPAKPKAQFLASTTGSGAWAEVTGFQHDPLADVPLLFTLTPVADIPTFQWTPEQLEDGFRGAKMSSSGLATGGQTDDTAVNKLLKLQ